MKVSKTERGFSISEFKDSYGEDCSLQKSSSVEDKIWLGVNGARMHLNREQVKNLLPYLKRFVKTGDLNQTKSEAE